MSSYWESSTIATVLLQQHGWEQLRELAATGPAPCFSDFGAGEVTSAIGINVRQGIVDATTGLAAADALGVMLAPWRRELLTQVDIARATSHLRNFTLGLRLPDALHIAIAERLNLTLITADRRQYAAAQVLGIAARNPFDEGA
ncbi:MAG: PIN domain-containing protein [Sphingomonas sp.]|uniref:PIN domain-containing protein n=1 Tax=Sphingomonas sp. TaxID=28214 RepID=UPI0025CD8F2A|nr:PIN domain-containing protein [Sphingomonas sp.]MBX9882803.1 PIN domain-containing protein [Sphingomonas sp.]